MKHITTQCCDTNPVSQHPNDTEPDQLSLRFFGLIEGYKRMPPERALWRELVNLAIGPCKSFRDGVRTVSASTLVLVAYALYMRANSAGIIEEFSTTLIAMDCRIGREHAQAALRVLNRLQVFRSTRASRRRPACHRMNLGGLDWPAVRARVKRPSGDPRSLLERPSGDPRSLLEQPSGDPRSLLEQPSGDPRSLLEQPSGDPRSPLSGDRGSPLKGYIEGDSTENQPVAAADPTDTAQTERPAAARITCPNPACNGHSWPAAHGPVCARCYRNTSHQPDDPQVNCTRCQGTVTASQTLGSGCVKCVDMTDVQVRNLRQARKWGRA